MEDYYRVGAEQTKQETQEMANIYALVLARAVTDAVWPSQLKRSEEK